MRVQPSQLVSGCVLLTDVMGKTHKPIVQKNTVLTEQHILLLQKFLIETVDVSGKLSDGKEFVPKMAEQEKNTKKTATSELSSSYPDSFEEHYDQVVANYKKMFTSWQSNVAIDMPLARQLLIPLFERVDTTNSAVYTLHHYATKKDYFYHHCVSVGILSAYLAKKMGYKKGEWLQVGLAGFLCDSGMAKIDPSIVTKTSALNLTELEEIKKHPTYSYRLVEHIPTITKAVKLAVLQHHERRDGSGYPLGLAKRKIHMYARIIAVCDMYHAMTCERLYKEKLSPFKVIEEIQKEQYSKLDPEVVQLFIESLSNFSIGTRVKLSNNKIAEIVFVESKQPTRPMVRLDGENEIITLKNESSLYINEILGN
ncbi:HD-GYP domain-containing protein [Virgibacillus byunsanensis]|uniref:HD-GYP domain-containing protein n=1 Tax=Virgibacillus byunsanensis TaxID=570945 RepID=A0ABW3LRN4_9BACI